MESRYNDFNIEVIKKTNYPLIKIMKNSYDKKLKAEKEKEQQDECKLLAVQTKGVNIVREHILKRKREFLCHQRERMLIKQVKKKELEENILHKYNINLRNIETRNKIAHKLINYDKSEKMKVNTQKQRMKFIVQKLITEMETKEKAKETSPPKPKIIKKKKPEPIELDDIIVEAEVGEDLVEEEIEPEEWVDLDVRKSRKTVDTKKSKKSLSSKKGSKKGTSFASKPPDDPNEYKMPHIPELNPRRKYTDATEAKMIDLIPPCQAMNAYLDDLKEFIAEMETYPVDPQFSSKPILLNFEDFENGKTYSDKLNIYNYSTDTAICSFERIVSDNEFCNVSLEVEDVGMQKIIPGKFYTLKVTFRPKNMQHLNGRLIFLIRRIHDSELKRFEVPVLCEIATIRLVVHPSLLIFKSIPVWEIKTHKSTDNAKAIEIYNGMINECKVVIRRKVDLPSVLEETNRNDFISDLKSSRSTFRKSRKSKKSKTNSVTIGKDDEDNQKILTNKFINNIIKSCVDYIDHIFFWNAYFIKLPPKSTTRLKAFCKELPHVGCFSESYEFEFISVSNNVLLTEEITLEAEVTGRFIVPEHHYLDFHTCMYNFIYQESVKIYNHGTSRLKIGFLFPSKLKKYFSIYPATFFMKPESHETVHIRFIPRTDLRQCKSKYFDNFTGILNFPVKICILAPRNLKVPPSSLPIYAIITETDNLNIRFSDKNNTYFNTDNTPILHLGTVTTHETVTANIEIENLSAISQEFGFLNLPEAIAIDPNYGFGTLNPNEIKTLKLLFSPTIYDMITVDKLHTYEPVEVSFKISCTTAYKLGEIKDKQIPETKIIQKQDISTPLSTELMLASYYEVETEDDLFEYHEYLFEQEELEEMYKHESDLYEGDIMIVDEENEIHDIQIVKNLTIILKATIVDYWTEISHQNIIFPDTPLGSYSTMNFQFSATNNTSAFIDCVCGFIKKSKLPNFDCHFEIFGGVESITVEPICGNLKKNEHKQIYLIAKPSPDSKLIFNQAQIMKEKARALSTAQKENKKGKAKSVRLSSKNSIDTELYLAEKEVWKSIKPYDIVANYVIVVNFTGDSYKSNEVIYLTVSCRVIKPQFITSLNTQVINFGYVPIGTRPRQIFKIQNVSRHVIKPQIQLMSPVGAFICTTQHKLLLEKEFILNIPITFSPEKEEVYNEYFEIKSENTIETVMVSGEGVEASYRIMPEFNVFRVSSKGSKFEDCIIQLDNQCKAPIAVQIVQTCELHGIVAPDPSKVNEEEQVSDKAGKADKKKENAASAKKPKTESMSLELSPDEEYSLANTFKIHDGPSPFKVQDLKDNIRIVQPFTKASIKIRFESPKIVEVIEKTPNETDAKSNKKAEPKGKKEKIITVQLDKEYKYVAKYNIMMGNIKLIKDFIIIGTFQ